jgi:hypothetical protein
MKEFSEQDIYDTNKLFQARLKKEADDQKRVFYRILITVLAIFIAGAIVGYLCA